MMISSITTTSKRQVIPTISITGLLLALFLIIITPSLASTRVQTAHKNIAAQLHHAAESFEHVYEQMTSSVENEIPVDPLLDACKSLSQVLHSTGPKAMARDFENNIKKIESARSQTKRRTIQSILQLERDSGVHREGNESSLYLRDQSGAMGLLWIRRTLAFQSEFFQQLLENENSQPIDAIQHAYQQELKPYHGWALTKCYNLMVGKKMPPRKSLLAMVGGYCDDDENNPTTDPMFYQQKEEKTLEYLQRLVESWQPLIQKWKHSFVELGMEDTRRV